VTVPLKDTLAANIVLRVPLHRGTLKDIGPFATDMAFVNTPYWQNSPRGKALVFAKAAATAAFVASTNVNAVQGSVSGWFKMSWASTGSYLFAIGGDNFSLLPNAVGSLRMFHDGGFILSTDITAEGGHIDAWFHVVATYLTGGSCVLFINGVQAGSAAAAGVDMDPTGNISVGASNSAGAYALDGGASGDLTVWNIQLTPAQATQLYQEEKRQAALTKTPVATTIPQPVNTLNNLVGHWPMTIEGNTVRDLSGNGYDLLEAVQGSVQEGALSGHGLTFDGTGGWWYTTALPANHWDGGGSIAMWVYVRSAGGGGNGRIIERTTRWTLVTQDSVGTGFCDLQFDMDFDGANGNWETTLNGAAYGEWTHVAVTYDSGPAAAAVDNDPIIYINGVSQALTENSTPVGTRVTDAGLTTRFGDRNTTDRSFDGIIDDLRIYSDILTAAEVAALYSEGENFVSLYGQGDDWEVSAANVTAGFLANTGWSVASGTWQVDDSSDGSKQITCIVAGILSLPSTQAFGQWEFDLYKDDGASTADVMFLATTAEVATAATQAGYAAVFSSFESIGLYEMTGGAKAARLSTNAAYAVVQTWYGIKVVRSASGAFSMYVRGGAFGADYILVDVAGGAGTNPVTDITVVSSTYATLDLDAGDAVRNFRFSPVIG
jgi:hypothetical protein